MYTWVATGPTDIGNKSLDSRSKSKAYIAVLKRRAPFPSQILHRKLPYNLQIKMADSKPNQITACNIGQHGDKESQDIGMMKKNEDFENEICTAPHHALRTVELSPMYSLIVTNILSITTALLVSTPCMSWCIWDSNPGKLSVKN